MTGQVDLGPLNDFHQLLILRMLRPDRLPSALAHYTDKHMNLHDPLEDSMNMAEVLLDARSQLGVLLLLPTSAASPAMVPESRLKLTSNPVDVLCGVAKVCRCCCCGLSVVVCSVLCGVVKTVVVAPHRHRHSHHHASSSSS